MARNDNPLHDHVRSPRGRQEAKKGDVQELDKETDDGPNRIEFKGRYESVGEEDRPEGHPEKISDSDKREMSDELDAWLKSGKKGPAPSFKHPNKEKDRYEIWRRKPKDFHGS